MNDDKQRMDIVGVPLTDAIKVVGSAALGVFVTPFPESMWEKMRRERRTAEWVIREAIQDTKNEILGGMFLAAVDMEIHITTRDITPGVLR